MVTAHVYETGGDEWACVDWPDQRVPATTFASRDIAKSTFVTRFNTTTGANITEDHVRFIGPILLTVEVTQTDERWRAHAIADKPYTVDAQTEDHAKTGFIAMWNDEHDQDITDENVDWT